MRTLTDADRAQIDGYLRTFSRGLSPLPKEERDEIVRETQSHLLDALAAGSGLSEATAALGDPSAYARRFVESYRIDAALASGSALRMLLAAGGLVGRGVLAFVGFHVFLFLFSTSVALVAMALVKPFAPEHVGLWITPPSFSFGVIARPDPTASEQLGWWIVPLGLFGGGLMFLATQRLLAAFLRLFRRRA